MRRLALLLPALLLVAACDSSSPEDALVGTWTLTAAQIDTRVTSSTAQTIPDRTVEPTGTIAITGATTASLGSVVNLFADADGTVNLAVESTSPLSTTGYVQLVLLETATESQASLIDADAGLSYNAYFTPRRSLIARSGGRFTVGPITMSSGTATATASGTLRYPDLALTPGTPAVVERFEEPFDGTVRFTFEEDGTFRATAFTPDDDQDVTGTWALVDGDVRVTVTQGGQTEVVTFRTTVEGNTLELVATDIGDLSCTDECLSFYESTAFATPGSISAVDFLLTYRFRSGTSAAARPVPAARRQNERAVRPTLPILGF